MKKFFRFLRNKYVIAAIIIVVIIVVFAIVHSKKSAPTIETTTATTTTVTELVSVTGSVTPFQKSDLGFEKGGTISTISVAVGDHVSQGQVIAALKDDQTYASLLGAEANVAAAEADLADNQTNTSIAYANSERNALSAAGAAYNKVDNAIVNDVDTLFTSGSSINPTLTVSISSYTEERNIEMKRYAVSQALEKWKSQITTLTMPDQAVELVADSRANLQIVDDFMTSLSAAVNEFVRNTPTAPQSERDSYLSTINSANTDINAANSSITSAQNDLVTTAPKSIQALQAKINQAKADLANYQAQYSASKITAPFNGIITVVTPQIGDIVGGGQVEFSMMADQSFKVEVNVPEADIAKVAVGDKANITLDAYGDGVVFGASVISIDPAETIVEGVPTYKVTLQFDQKDDRVRSGMTANIDIIVASKSNVVAVPFRAVVTDDSGNTMVRIVNPDGKTFTSVPVQTGIKGSDGLVEIVSGLDSGTEIVTFAQ